MFNSLAQATNTPHYPQANTVSSLKHHSWNCFETSILYSHTRQVGKRLSSWWPRTHRKLHATVKWLRHNKDNSYDRALLSHVIHRTARRLSRQALHHGSWCLQLMQLRTADRLQLKTMMMTSGKWRELLGASLQRREVHPVETAWEDRLQEGKYSKIYEVSSCWWKIS